MRRRLLRRRAPAAKVRGLSNPPLARPAYADRHPGRTALVLGNGPSLSEHGRDVKALVAARQALVLGANHVTPFCHPDYHAFTNRKRFFEYASTVDTRLSTLLVAPTFEDEFVRAHVDAPYERLMYVTDNDAAFGIEDGVITAGCRTVSVLLIGVAVVMGVDEIFVAGLDGFAGDQPGPRYHAATSVLKGDRETLEDVGRYTTRFLAEIQEHLSRHGRRPFRIVTPTAYTEHYDPQPLEALAP